MENESNLQVTFSKRRVGLFKKASELCTLSGAEAAIVVFSPGNKAHSFGHPDANTIADRFLTPNSPPVNVANQSTHVQQSSDQTRQKDLEYLAQVESLIEAEKARGEELDQIRKACEKEKWIPSAASIDKLNYQQLDHLKGAVKDFGKNLETQVEKAVKPMMQYDVVPGTYSESFDVSSHGTIVPYGVGNNTVIPYDQGATTGAGEADMSHQFNTGYGRGHF
ncbi:hypothetical protein Pfo_002198 [Paulownia fortunei]|nr:hypothetical protein Pfo_002198 [Paulownia fortunei]